MKPVPTKSKSLNWDICNSKSLELFNSDKIESQMAGLYIQIALRTGLRAGDVLGLEKIQFDFTEKTVSLKTMKTKIDCVFYLPKNVMDFIYFLPNENIFFNSKQKTIYTNMWINRRLKLMFPNEVGVSSHSLRKTVGKRAYEVGGINGAKNMLTHASFQHTSVYLELDKMERLNFQKGMFEGK